MSSIVHSRVEALRSARNDVLYGLRALAHDLRPLMQTIKAHTLRLAACEPDDPARPRYVATILQCLARAEAMICSAANYVYATNEQSKKTWVDAEIWLQASIQNILSSIDESRAQITHSEMPTVYANDIQLMALFQNLIGNAIKFCDKASPRIHVSASHDGLDWIFSVEDNGRGIDDRYRERIFRPFERLDTTVPGSGIGLATCKAIVENHGGCIWCESRLGKGTIFYFTLPLIDET
jgi:signal transduction histidine kinase